MTGCPIKFNKLKIIYHKHTHTHSRRNKTDWKEDRKKKRESLMRDVGYPFVPPNLFHWKRKPLQQCLVLKTRVLRSLEGRVVTVWQGSPLLPTPLTITSGVFLPTCPHQVRVLSFTAFTKTSFFYSTKGIVAFYIHVTSNAQLRDAIKPDFRTYVIWVLH